MAAWGGPCGLESWEVEAGQSRQAAQLNLAVVESGRVPFDKMLKNALKVFGACSSPPLELSGAASMWAL